MLNKRGPKVEHCGKRSVSTAPKTLPLSTGSFHFSNNVKRHRCVRKPFLKPHWFLKNTSSKKEDICLLMLYSNFLIELVKWLLACGFASHLFFLSFAMVSHLQVKTRRKQRRFNGNINTSTKKISEYVKVFVNNF